MRNYEELFEELKDLQKHVCYVSGWCCEIVFIEDDGYRFKDFHPDNFMQKVGYFNEEMVIDAFTHPENEPLKNIDKPGYYEFDALLSYTEDQVGEYGRIEIRGYMMIEHIEFKYQCSFEEMAELEKSDNNQPLLDF